MLLYLSQMVPDGIVLAFEPGEHAAAWLAECLSVNSHLPVEIVRCALGQARGEAFLESRGAEHFHGGWNAVNVTRGERIEIVRLDEIVREREIEEVNLWKLDVEGYEIPALRGAMQLLESQKIHAIRVELAGENGTEIRRFLAEVGYSCFLFNWRDKLVPAGKLPPHTNGLFLPRPQ